MFGQTRPRRLVELPQLNDLGPVRIDVDGCAALVQTIAEEQADFGGLVQARLEADHGSIQVTLRYAAYKVAAGALPAHAVTEQLYLAVSRERRRGHIVACAVDLVESGGGYDVWLNYPQFDAMLAPFAQQRVHEPD